MRLTDPHVWLATRYPDHIEVDTIVWLVVAGMGPDQVARWPRRFTCGRGIAAMRDAGLTPAQADVWPQRLTGMDIAVMHQLRMTPWQAAQWPVRFDGSDIVELHCARVGPTQALRFPFWMRGWQIRELLDLGVDAKTAHRVLAEPLTTEEFVWMIEAV